LLVNFSLDFSNRTHRMAVMMLAGYFDRIQDTDSEESESPEVNDCGCSEPCAPNGCAVATDEAETVPEPDPISGDQGSTIESELPPVESPVPDPATTPVDEGLKLVPAKVVDSAVRTVYESITKEKGKAAGAEFGKWVATQCAEFGKTRIGELDERSRSILYERLGHEFDVPF